jgi:ribosomal protein S18 acetylase RimI-like enzyme
VIRPLVKHDLPALCPGLAELPLLRRYGRSAAKLQGILEAALERGEGLIVWEEGGELLGLSWFLTTGTLALGGYLRLLAVIGPAQKRGVGAKLLEGYEAEVAKASHHAFLLASLDNAGAHRFYERHGYRRVGVLPSLVLPGEDEVLFWKRLRK